MCGPSRCLPAAREMFTLLCTIEGYHPRLAIDSAGPGKRTRRARTAALPAWVFCIPPLRCAIVRPDGLGGFAVKPPGGNTHSLTQTHTHISQEEDGRPTGRRTTKKKKDRKKPAPAATAAVRVASGQQQHSKASPQAMDRRADENPQMQESIGMRLQRKWVAGCRWQVRGQPSRPLKADAGPRAMPPPTWRCGRGRVREEERLGGLKPAGPWIPRVLVEFSVLKPGARWTLQRMAEKKWHWIQSPNAGPLAGELQAGRAGCQ